MSCSKYAIALTILALISGGCSGAPKKTVSPRDGMAVKRFEKITVPGKIAPADRIGLEKTLVLLPEDHPERIPLRDRLAESYAASFEKLSDDEISKKLDLFTSGLTLHAPSDFRPSKVAEALVKPAGWITDRYESRGDEAIVLASLRFMMLARPDDARYEERYRELSEWSESVRMTIIDDVERLSSICDMYLKVARLIPDRDLVDHLAGLLVERHGAMLRLLDELEWSKADQSGFMVQMLMQRAGMGKDIVHIYFLAGDPAAAMAPIRKMGLDDSIGAQFIELLEDISEGDDPGESYFVLAGMLGRDDPRSGLRACITARSFDRKDPRFPICIGMAFETLGRPESAVDFYVEAAKIAPEEEIYAAVLDRVQTALFDLHRMEKTVEAQKVIEVGDRLARKALELKDIGEELIPVTTASLLHTAGLVEFDDGRISAAEDHFLAAHEIWPSLFGAVDKLVEIKQARGKHKEAIALLDGAMSARGKGAQKPSAFWMAVFLEKRADSLLADGRDSAAKADYRKALEKWKDSDTSVEILPVEALRIGIIQDRLGNEEASLESFRKAIRLDSDRSSTYAGILSFLVTGDRLEEAKEFYRLAFNQDRIEVMWKIYFSLWMEGFSGRKSGKSFDLAQGYLEQSDGKSWQDDLARFFSGRITADKLRERAANVGQNVETDFYVSVKLLSNGKKSDAMPLLKKVLDSDLMGFFEYPMARAFLDK
jgi:tetratricopeptide (TPR) repeat protein